MPALPPVPNVIKARLLWTLEGDASVFTICHFRYSGGAPSEADLTSFTNALQGAASSDLVGEYLASTTLTSVDCRDLSSPMGSFAESVAGTPGTRTGTRLPPAAAALVNYGVKRSYRGGKPRSYWPFGASADVASTGFWTDAFVTEYEGQVNTFFGGVIPSTWGALTIEAQCQVSYYGPPNRVLTNPSTGRARTVSTRRDAPGGTGAPIVDDVRSRAGTKVIGSQRRRNKNA